jgi:hypothetical protein
MKWNEADWISFFWMICLFFAAFSYAWGGLSREFKVEQDISYILKEEILIPL